jgi:RNA polymerase sigma-70 factor (ECF subfamily)
MAECFHDDLVAMLPKLRVQALALTRNRTQAEDLVQETVVRALAARDSFQPGTNFAAWLHRILRNHFISEYRKRRETVAIEDAPPAVLSGHGVAEDKIALRELWGAMDTLGAEQREMLVMVAVEGMSYEQVAEVTGVPVGTAKCRVFRARRQLQAMLLPPETPAPARGYTGARPRAATEAAGGRARALGASACAAPV